MNRYERLNALLEKVVERGRVDIEEAAADLAVSAATIRRDLDHLAQQHLVTRTHGGALALNVALDLPLRYKAARHAEEKQRIALAAATLVQPDMVVGLNGGTTTTEVARALATSDELRTVRSDPAITVVTNALNIGSDLTVRPHVKVVVTGGVARPQSYELIGPMVAGMMEDLLLDVIFLGVDAIDVRHGACAHHEGEALTNRALTARAHRVVVVADSSKLERPAFARICPLSTVDTLITDTRATDETIARFEEAGVKVMRA